MDWPHRRQVAPSWASWNWFCLRYLGCGLATQETSGSFLSQLELVLLTVPWLWTGHTGDKWFLPAPVRTGSAYGTLVVDGPHGRQVIPSCASWNRFCLRYLSCRLDIEEIVGSFLTQLELVRLTLPWLWTGHTGDRWLLPEPAGTGSAYVSLAVDWPHRR